MKPRCLVTTDRAANSVTGSKPTAFSLTPVPVLPPKLAASPSARKKASNSPRSAVWARRL